MQFFPQYYGGSCQPERGGYSEDDGRYFRGCIEVDWMIVTMVDNAIETLANTRNLRWNENSNLSQKDQCRFLTSAKVGINIELTNRHFRLFKM